MLNKTFGQMLSFLVFCGVFGIYQNVQAACIWNGNTGAVASPYDHADVQACVTDAASCATSGPSGCITTDGSVTISIPASQVNWDDRVSIDMSDGFANVTSLTVWVRESERRSSAMSAPIRLLTKEDCFMLPAFTTRKFVSQE